LKVETAGMHRSSCDRLLQATTNGVWKVRA